MKYKIFAVLALCVLLFCGCAESGDEAPPEDMSASGGSLEELWTDFKENMPQDRNVEDDFRNSDFISELKAVLAERDSFDMTAEELYDMTGINDVSVTEASSGGMLARVIYVGADLYNKAVTDVSVRNKYMFLQMTDGTGYYFKTVNDGDFAFPQDILLLEGGGKYYAVIISKYCAVYPEGVLIQAYTVENGNIVPVGIFGEYGPQGIKTQSRSDGILFETSYEEGSSFGEISRLTVYSEADGKITMVSGENTFVMNFDGEKYTSDGSGEK